VLAQTFEDFQINVYDDASGDDTAAVVQSIARRDSRVHYFRHAEHVGIMANFGYGISQARTPYFHVMSDDDLVLPDFFRPGLLELQAHSEAMLFVGRLILAQPDGHVFGVTGEEWTSGLEYPPSTFFKLIGGHTWTSMIFRREVLESVGTLDPEVGPAGDQDFELRVAARHPAVISNALCGIFCIHSGSSTVRDPVGPLLIGIPGIMRNVGQVIDQGVRDRLIAVDAGEAMRTAMLAGLRQQLLSTALVAACRGQRESAIAAVRFLAECPGCGIRTSLLRVLASPALPRPLVSTAYELARASRRVWRNHKHADLATVVSNAFKRADVAASSQLSTGS